MNPHGYRRNTCAYALSVPNCNTARGRIEVELHIEPRVFNNWEFAVQVESVSRVHSLLMACAPELDTLNLISPSVEKTALLTYLRNIGSNAHTLQDSFMRGGATNGRYRY
jgi:hypothetical protein